MLAQGEPCCWTDLERTVCSNPSCIIAEDRRVKAAERQARPRKYGDRFRGWSTGEILRNSGAIGRGAGGRGGRHERNEDCTSRCAVEGCESRAAAGAPYCLRCADEIEGLELWNRLAESRRVEKERIKRDRRENQRRGWFHALVDGVRRRLWIANLILAAAGLLYLGSVAAAVFVAWIDAGSVR